MAALLAERRPLALNLDVDAVRGSLGGWLGQPHESGLAARRLAIAMATTHLAGGQDVIVPQLLVRDRFILELQAAAEQTGATFVEIALIVDRDHMIRAFEARSSNPANQRHVDAHQLVEQSGGTESLIATYDALTQFLDTRPNARRVAVIPGALDATLAAVEAAITEQR